MRRLAPEAAAVLIGQVRHEFGRVIVGQERVLERVLVALLAGGHCLLEGVPGVGKTLTVASLAKTLGGTFTRIQFTPDLIPADIVGTRIYRPSTEQLRRGAGPDLRQLRPRRRDQPGAGQGPVGAARGDGRAPGHHRRRHPSAAAAVPRAGHAEPHRVRRRVPAARGPARPLPAARPRRLPAARRGARDRGPHGDGARRRPTGCCRPRTWSPLQRAAAAVVVSPEVADYAVRLVLATRQPTRHGLAAIDGYLGLRGQPPRQHRPRRRRPGPGAPARSQLRRAPRTSTTSPTTC